MGRQSFAARHLSFNEKCRGMKRKPFEPSSISIAKNELRPMGRPPSS